MMSKAGGGVEDPEKSNRPQTGQTRGTACWWRQQPQQPPAALRHPSYDEGTTRLPRGLRRGRRRRGNEARWRAGRESRQLGTGQGKGGRCCGARSESEAGGTAGSTCCDTVSSRCRAHGCDTCRYN
eukprot:1458081-Rhodomonas_salina.1